MNDEARKLLKALDAMTSTKPAYLPSAAWDAVVREGAVIDQAKSDAIREAIKKAPEAVVAKVFGQVVSVLGGILT